MSEWTNEKPMAKKREMYNKVKGKNVEKQEILSSGRQNSFREIVSISIEKRWTTSFDAILCHIKDEKTFCTRNPITENIWLDKKKKREEKREKKAVIF